METVSVNGTEIPAAVIVAEIQNHRAESADAARAQAIRALVIRELLLQEAHRLGLTPEPVLDAKGRREVDDEALIRQLLDDQLPVPDADEASCRRYYDKNQARFRSPDIFEAAHILLSASPDDDKAYDAVTREAEAIITAVTDRPGAFSDIARDRSDCSSARDGGRLGQITRGQTLPEFETFLFALEEGQLSPVPVKTRYGVHVLRLDHRIDGATLPFEAVRSKIAEYLEESGWRIAASHFVKRLAGLAKFVGVELDATAGPYAQ
jgi:peptidyl-prolyl cis-trans isomerase C